MALDHGFSPRGWRHEAPVDLGAAAGVPTMLSTEEQRFYMWLTQNWREGDGTILDLGTFVGGSTARLAEGLRRSGRPGLIHGVDRFEASEESKERHLYRHGVDPFPGDDLLGLAETLLAPWADRVRLQKGNLSDLSVDVGAIDILVVDLAKTAADADLIAERFYPRLTPVDSIVVHQDFLHRVQPWLPVQMELLADHFVPVAHARPDTVAFLCHTPVDMAAARAARTSELSDAEYRDLLQAAARRFERWGIGARILQMIDVIEAGPGHRSARELKRARRRTRT